MATPANETLPGIKQSWTLMAFAQSHGKPSLTQEREFVNTHTGESFTARSMAFTHPTEKDDQGRNKVCFVGFSRNLGMLSAAEIVARKDSLNVVEFENGNYALCERGSNAWEDIDLGL